MVCLSLSVSAYVCVGVCVCVCARVGGVGFQDDEPTPNVQTSVTSLDVTTLADATPPVFPDAFPRLDNIADFSFDVVALLDEAATVYVVVVPNGDTAPTATEVSQGHASGGSTPLDSGNAPAVADTAVTLTMSSGFAAATPYDVYVAAKVGCMCVCGCAWWYDRCGWRLTYLCGACRTHWETFKPLPRSWMWPHWRTQPRLCGLQRQQCPTCRTRGSTSVAASMKPAQCGWWWFRGQL